MPTYPTGPTIVEAGRAQVTTPRLAASGELAPIGAEVHHCAIHGQTIGASACIACAPEERFGNATAAQVGEQELSR